MSKYNIKASFNGEIRDIPFISVDNFENVKKSAYFLSHYHSDHFRGIDNTFLPSMLKENKALIYASEVTIAIIKNHQSGYLFPYLKELKLGRNTITITKDEEEIYLNVTVLPAGHCIGSVMFLFEYKKTILFTGDFRITQNDIKRYTHLHKKNGDPIHIDVLYVDTTFQNVPCFPRRSEVIENVVTKIREWLDADKRNNVYLKTSANYGYECICNSIYEATKIKCYLGPEKWKVFSQFPKEMYGITDQCNSRIQMGFKNKRDVPLALQEHFPTTLTIYFSAFAWQNDNNNEDYIEVAGHRCIKFCFSLHCGRDELMALVNYLQPDEIIGFPNRLIRNSPVKIDSKASPLKIVEVRHSKRSRQNSVDSESPLGKKLTKEHVKRMFDW